MGGEHAAVAVHKAKLRVRNLPTIGFAAQLAHRFDDVEHTARRPRMPEGQKAPMGVAGQRPAMGQRPLERRRPRFTLTEEADGFELDQQGYGETVVDFRDVDIAVAHPGFGEGPLGGLFTAEIGQRGSRNDMLVRVSLSTGWVFVSDAASGALMT